jgi:hypothetical protein
VQRQEPRPQTFCRNCVLAASRISSRVNPGFSVETFLKRVNRPKIRVEKGLRDNETRGEVEPSCLWIWWCSSTASCTRDSQMRISNKRSLCGLRTKRNANFDSDTSATGTPQESRIWREHFIIEVISMKTLANGM